MTLTSKASDASDELTEHARVRVGAIDKPTGWWFASVAQVEDDGSVTVQRHCADPSNRRTFPVDQVQRLTKDDPDRNWMLGLTVPIACKRSKAHKSGMVVNVNGSVTIEYSNNMKEKRAYQAVLDFLFAHAANVNVDNMPWNKEHEAYEGPLISLGTQVYKEFNIGWFFGVVDQGPLHRIITEDGKYLEQGYYFHITYTDGDDEWMSPSETENHVELASQQLANTAKPRVLKDSKQQHIKSKKVTSRRASKRSKTEQVNGDESLEDNDDEESCYSDGENHVNTKRRGRKAGRAARKKQVSTTLMAMAEGDAPARKQPPRRVTFGQPEEMKLESDEEDEYDGEGDEELKVSAVREEESKPVTPLSNEDPVHGYKELNNSLSMLYDGSLLSKECSVGVAGYRRMLEFHRMYMCKNSRKKMIDTLIFGPIGHTPSTRFPDKLRTMAVVETVNRQLTVGGMHDIFAAELAEFGWEECLQQVTRPIFAARGDEQRVTQDAMLRVGDSLVVKAHAVEFLGQILEHEQRRCLPSRDGISKKALLGTIANSGSEAKGALDVAVKAYLHVLIHHGPFLIGSSSILLGSREDGPNYRCLHQLKTSAEKLFFGLGKVVSILAWLYGIHSHERVIDVSHFIGSLVLNELRSTMFDPEPFKDATAPSGKEYWTSIKFRCLMGLRRELLPQLRPLLAEKLSVAAVYNEVMG